MHARILILQFLQNSQRDTGNGAFFEELNIQVLAVKTVLMLGAGKVISFGRDPVEIGLFEFRLIGTNPAIKHIAPIGAAFILPAVGLPTFPLAYFGMLYEFIATWIICIEVGI